MTIPRLQAKVVVGAANNQLEQDRNGEMLAERGILYLPDYVANGGGLVSCAAEWYRHDLEEVVANVEKIYGTCAEILEHFELQDLPTHAVSNQLAEARFKR